MIVVVFGASGDLAKRKIFPSLSACSKKPSAIVGYGRADLRTTYCERLTESFAYDEEFLEIIEYIRGDYYDLSLLHKFKNEEVLLYFSVPPSVYDLLLSEAKNFTRGFVALEKPFALAQHDLARIDIFTRENPALRILLIDHYLLKPLVAVLPILKARFPALISVLKQQNISAVCVTAKEQLGIEGRAYFDETGIVRDIVQNHLLALVASVFAAPPEALVPVKVPDCFEKVASAARAVRSALHSVSFDGASSFDVSSEGPSFPLQEDLARARTQLYSEQQAKFKKEFKQGEDEMEDNNNVKNEKNVEEKVREKKRDDEKKFSENNGDNIFKDVGMVDADNKQIDTDMQQDNYTPFISKLSHDSHYLAHPQSSIDNSKIGLSFRSSSEVIFEDFTSEEVTSTFNHNFFEKLASSRTEFIRTLNLKKEYALFGQYEGYETELGKKSNTETYACVVCKNYEKVPFVFVSGKGLDKKLTEVKIIFKQNGFKETIEALVTSSSAFQKVKIHDITGVELIFNIYPHNCIYLCVKMKSHIKKYEIVSTKIIDSIYKNIFGSLTDHSLIFDSILSNKSFPTTSLNETKLQWALFDIEYIKKKRGLFKYQKGIDVPQEVAEFLISCNLNEAIHYDDN